MKYLASIEIPYVAGRDPITKTIGETLASVLSVDLRQTEIGFMARDLAVTWGTGRTVAVGAVLDGISGGKAVGPIETLSRLDAALDRALDRMDLKKDFDLVRRALRVDPA